MRSARAQVGESDVRSGSFAYTLVLFSSPLLVFGVETEELPEPSTIALFAVGILVAAFVANWKRKKR